MNSFSRKCLTCDWMVLETLLHFNRSCWLLHSFRGFWWFDEKRQFPALKVIKQCPCNGLNIGFTFFKKTPHFFGKLLQKILRRSPRLEAICLFDILSFDPFQDGRNEIHGTFEVLNSDDAFQHRFSFGVTRWIYNTGAIDEVNTVHQSNILPHLQKEHNHWEKFIYCMIN